MQCKYFENLQHSLRVFWKLYHTIKLNISVDELHVAIFTNFVINNRSLVIYETTAGLMNVVRV